ncbi:MAG: hypothetical protein KDA49_02270, partial [Rhodospirillaceae bacterium]|nr:hypothetical protein [Rhodospirillaceae bacterium]
REPVAVSDDAEQAGQPMSAEMLRRRRGRNVAILVALMVFAGLIYWISVVRIGAGIEADLERQQQEEQGAEPADAPDDHALLVAPGGTVG